VLVFQLHQEFLILGLYNSLHKYNLPHPTAIFEINYFKNNPKPFFTIAKDLYPKKFKPTPVHYFIRLLYEKKLLLRSYTQNIDTLERIAGVPDSLLIESHGSFAFSHCTKCKKEHPIKIVEDAIFNDRIPICECSGIIKKT